MKIQQAWLCVAVIVSILVGGNAIAQDKLDEESYGIFDNRDQYYQFMGGVKREGENNPELMAMVPMLNDIVLEQPIGSTGKRYNASDSTLGLLANESVRKELEMVDDQFAELQKANAEIQQRVAEQLRELDLSDMKAATQQILAIRDQSEKDLQATLLPHQMRRLRQIVAQNQMRRRTLVQWLTSEPWRTELEISQEQADQLRHSEKEIQADLRQKIAQLQEEARQRLLGKLKKSQRQQVEEWIGEEFEFKNRVNE